MSGRVSQCDYLSEHQITCDSGVLPAVVQRFSDAPFSPSTRAELKAAGFTRPTPIQASCWPIATAGNDLIAIAETGAGKTLAYLLPAILHLDNAIIGQPASVPRSLVLAPTRELAQQIHTVAERFCGRARCTLCCGGRDIEPQQQQLADGTELVVGTPGRLLYFAAKGAIDLSAVDFWVLDEADRMLDMGFAPQVQQLATELPVTHQTLLLSATWCAELDGMAASLVTASVVRLSIGQHAKSDATACANISQRVEVLAEQLKLPRLVSELTARSVGEQQGEKVLIFANTKKGCDQLARDLRGRSIHSADAIHADRLQADREAALADFVAGTCRCLVATDVAARGIHVNDIALVVRAVRLQVVRSLEGSSQVNWDFPCTTGAAGVEDYVHRIGRTGRAGKKGASLTFFPTKADDKHPANSHFLLKMLQSAAIPVDPLLYNLDRGDLASARSNRKSANNGSRAEPQIRKVSGSAAQRAVRFELVQLLNECGDRRDRAAAEAGWARFAAEQVPHSVYSFSAGIKAAVSCGDVGWAAALFKSMANASVEPNIVVYTTLLKGYAAAGDVVAMQQTMSAMTAAKVHADIRTVNTFLRGCVRVGEANEALKLFDQVCTDSDPSCCPDATSYKYASRLLSQTLRLTQLDTMVSQLRQAEINGENGAWGLLNALGNNVALHLDVATAAALLGDFKIASTNLRRAEAALDTACRKNDTLFDTTRIEELRMGVTALQPFVAAAEPIECRDSQFARLLLFSARLNQADSPHDVQTGSEVASALAAQLEQTCGLDQCGKDAPAACTQLSRCVSSSGRLRWERIFEAPKELKSKDEATGNLPVKIEVCSGSGDWVVAQAAAEAGEANWASMELRHDRVHAVWQKMVIQNVRNMCVLGGDAARVLRHHIKPKSVSRVCVNFPEPPHWTGSTEADSKLHLLTAQFFRTVHTVLEPGGGMTILSDNHQYCQSLAAEIGRLKTAASGEAMFVSTDVSWIASTDGGYEDIEGIRIYEGLPGKQLGHAVNASSQFDRFWESGSYTKRYFLAVDKMQVQEDIEEERDVRESKRAKRKRERTKDTDEEKSKKEKKETEPEEEQPEKKTKKKTKKEKKSKSEPEEGEKQSEKKEKKTKRAKKEKKSAGPEEEEELSEKKKTKKEKKEPEPESEDEQPEKKTKKSKKSKPEPEPEEEQQPEEKKTKKEKKSKPEPEEEEEQPEKKKRKKKKTRAAESDEAESKEKKSQNKRSKGVMSDQDEEDSQTRKARNTSHVEIDHSEPPRNSKQKEQGLDVKDAVDVVLASLGLTHLKPLLEAEQVDCQALRLMNDADLKELGVPKGSRLKLCQWISTEPGS